MEAKKKNRGWRLYQSHERRPKKRERMEGEERKVTVGVRREKNLEKKWGRKKI